MPAAAAVAAVLLAAGPATGSASRTEPGAGDRPTDARLPAGSYTTHGGSAALYYRTAKLGLLHIRVESTTTVNGTIATVRYERHVGCKAIPGTAVPEFGTCRVAWTERHALDGTEFSIDPALSGGRFEQTLRRQRLSVTWEGHPFVVTERDPRGLWIAVVRAATAKVQWGPTTTTDEMSYGTSRLYRRARLVIP
jgi:hypothetical protein